ncbi:MAG: hypothetical protein IPJ16_08290 [Bacteroidales bacterium]|nr:hypothetical protein [Bacteroidales bacterium]
MANRKVLFLKMENSETSQTTGLLPEDGDRVPVMRVIYWCQENYEWGQEHTALNYEKTVPIQRRLV